MRRSIALAGIALAWSASMATTRSSWRSSANTDPTLADTVVFPTPPLPITPILQKEQEDKFWVKERYGRVPILGPTTAGGPAVALDPPTPDEVMRALERARDTHAMMLLALSRSKVSQWLMAACGDEGAWPATGTCCWSM